MIQMLEVAKTMFVYGLGTILGFIPIAAIILGVLAAASKIYDKWETYQWEREQNDR